MTHATRSTPTPRLAHAAATLLLAPFALSGCLSAHSPLASDPGDRPLEIVGVDAPTDVRAGQPVTVMVRARLHGRCWQVGEARAAVDGRAHTVTLAGTARPDPALPCAQGADDGAPAVREEVLALAFTPLAAGTYRFEVPHGIDRRRLERTIRVLD